MKLQLLWKVGGLIPQNLLLPCSQTCPPPFPPHQLFLKLPHWWQTPAYPITAAWGEARACEVKGAARACEGKEERDGGTIGTGEALSGSLAVKRARS